MGIQGDDGDISSALEILHNASSLLTHQRGIEPTDNDTGVCVDCGEDIEPARLVARPGCRRCIFCQEFNERQGRRVR